MKLFKRFRSTENTLYLSGIPKFVTTHDKLPIVKSLTIDNYKQAVRTLISSVGDDIRVNKITVRDLRKWQVDQEKAVMVTTANNRKRSMRSMLNKLALVGEIESRHDQGRVVSVVADCISMKPEGRKTCRAMLQSTYEAMYAVASLKWRVVFCVMWHSGIRRGEVCSMEAAKTKFWRGENDVLCAEFYVCDKGDKPRWVAFKGEPAEHLHDWIYNQRSRNTTNIYTFMGNAENAPMGKTTINSAFRKYSLDAGVRDEVCNPHGMRHHFAQWLLERGIAVNVAAAAMGIDPATFLANYVTPNDETVRAALLA